MMCPWGKNPEWFDEWLGYQVFGTAFPLTLFEAVLLTAGIILIGYALMADAEDYD